MATVTATKENFEQLAIDNDIVLVDFWASWCGPCRMFGPVFEIMSIPTLMVLRDEVIVYARPGALPGAALDELIGKVRALDMDAVHHQLADAQAVPGP